MTAETLASHGQIDCEGLLCKDARLHLRRDGVLDTRRHYTGCLIPLGLHFSHESCFSRSISKDGMKVQWLSCGPACQKGMPWWHPCQATESADLEPAELIDICMTFGGKVNGWLSNSVMFCYSTIYCWRPVVILKEVDLKGEKVVHISHSLPIEVVQWQASEMDSPLKLPSEWTGFLHNEITVSMEFVCCPRYRHHPLIWQVPGKNGELPSFHELNREVECIPSRMREFSVTLKNRAR